MLGFLQGCGNNLWARSLTTRATEQLVKAAIELNEVFLASDVIHRSRIFSLYAAESGLQRIPKAGAQFLFTGRQHLIQASGGQIFDWYTATLGLPTELAVPDDGDDGEIPFPSLADKICFGLRGRSFIPQQGM